MDKNLSKLEDRGAWCAVHSPWGCKDLDMIQQLNNTASDRRRTNSEKWNLLGLRRHPPAILLPRL